MSTAKDLIYLVSCAVNEKKPDTDRIRCMDLDAVYALASRHMLTAAAAFALESAGYTDRRSGTAIAAAMRKTVLFDKEWGEIREKLEEAGIWYMPLKGAVVKAMYPRYGMREFSDHDILFDAAYAGDVKTIMEGLGYTAGHFGINHHDCYYKPPVLNFEMHRALFAPGHEEKLYEYYRDPGKRLIRGSGCARCFTPEDFYLYLLAHEYKHYVISGTGLRSLLDTYVYLRKQPLDMAYVAAEAEKMGIADFEEKNRSLSLHLFSGAALTDADQEMLAYMLASGTYGTLIHRVQNRMRRNDWGRLQYMLNRFFVPVSRKNKDYPAYAGAYPFFYKYKILLPFLPFYRTFRAMKAGRFAAEAAAIKKVQR